LLLAALLIGIVNALVRPVVIVLTLPITILTLGIFLLVVNAAMFGLVAWLLGGFAVSGFFAALFGWIIVSLVSGFASWFIGPRGRYEVMVIERHSR
jgi:putative membrane protein